MMRLSSCFWQLGLPGYDSVCRTRNQREGYRRVELCYHRWTDPFYTHQSFHRAERTERIPVGHDAACQRRPDVPQGFDFLRAGDVEIEGSDWLGRRLLFLTTFWSAKAGPAGGIRSFYLPFERRSRARICR